jgi:hypothetical protein
LLTQNWLQSSSKQQGNEDSEQRNPPDKEHGKQG